MATQGHMERSLVPGLTTSRRAVVALAIGCFAAAVVYAGHQPPVPKSDWDEIWAAGRALLDGFDPYAALAVGHHSDQFNYPLVYPAPAVLVAVPFALLPLQSALPLWAGLGTAALAWTLLARGWWGLLGLGSAFYLHALISLQWAPLLTAAVAVPALGFVWAAKPTVGAALFVGWPSRAALIGGLALVGLSFMLMPGWVPRFLTASLAMPHTTPPAMRPGGFLLLLSFLRWRRSEARMLGVLALVPQTTLLYEMVPLLLIPRTWREMLVLVALSIVTGVFALQTDPSHHLTAAIISLWPLFLLAVYLPCVCMVLMRENVANASNEEYPTMTASDPTWAYRPALILTATALLVAMVSMMFASWVGTALALGAAVLTILAGRRFWEAWRKRG
jgi:hypothetical protein